MNNEKRRFSVLLSVYYKENPLYLRESLNSIFNQTLLPTEVILVEDGPLNDELYAVIKEFTDVQHSLKILPLDRNVGLGLALRKGMEKCQYEYIARMDSDDICFPDRFEKQMKYLEENPRIDVLGCWTQEFITDGDGRKIMLALKKFPSNPWDNFKYCTKRCPVEHPAVIFKKSAVLAVGGYQHCLLFEDYHLWARMFVNGAIFQNLQEPLLYFRTSIDAIKRRGGWKYAINELHALKEFHEIGFLNKMQLIYSIIVRFPVRIMPTSVRKIIYIFLRNKN